MEAAVELDELCVLGRLVRCSMLNAHTAYSIQKQEGGAGVLFDTCELDHHRCCSRASLWSHNPRE